MELIQYLILQHPGHNRVFYHFSGELALSELKLASKKLSSLCTDINIEVIAGARYLSIVCEEELKTKDLILLANLSFVFSLFRAGRVDGKLSLIPLEIPLDRFVDEKISSLLKYSGKTNELFTRMMVNVGLLSSDFCYDDGIQLLDPVAGKGTTLYEAARYGYDAYGIELDPKSVHASTVFFKQYLETERYKHNVEKRQIGGSNKREASYIQEFSYAASKEDFKVKDNRKFLGLVAGDSKDAASFFKKNYFHLIIGDLPYGIAHGNVVAKKSGALSRSPEVLIQLCLPGWVSVLKTGGVLVLAWNSFVVSKNRLAQILEGAGLRVFLDEPYGNFEHMVDKSIKRDILVAIKTN